MERVFFRGLFAIVAMTASTTAVCQNPQGTGQSEVECQDSRNDIVTDAVCDAIAAVKEAGASAVQQSSQGQPQEEISFSDIISSRELWRDGRVFDRLDESGRYRVLSFFMTEGGNRVYNEWACKTGKWHRADTQTLLWAGRLFPPTIQELAIEEHRLHMTLLGFGSNIRRCNYSGLAGSIREFEEDIAFLQATLDER